MGKVLHSAAVLLVAVANIVVTGGAAHGHNDPPECQSNISYRTDPYCRAHLQNSHLLYHWGSVIAQAHHAGERARFGSGVYTWTSVASPNSPWHVHYNTDVSTHADMLTMSGGALGVGVIPQEDAADHYYVVLRLALRHNITDLGVTWYTGTATPGGTQVDAWEVWAEELGHVQNVSHHIPPGHEYHSHQHTMSGSSTVASVTKRSVTPHEATHACLPYRRVHASC